MRRACPQGVSRPFVLRGRQRHIGLASYHGGLWMIILHHELSDEPRSIQMRVQTLVIYQYGLTYNHAEIISFATAIRNSKEKGTVAFEKSASSRSIIATQSDLHAQSNKAIKQTSLAVCDLFSGPEISLGQPSRPRYCSFLVLRIESLPSI